LVNEDVFELAAFSIPTTALGIEEPTWSPLDLPMIASDAFAMMSLVAAMLFCLTESALAIGARAAGRNIEQEACIRSHLL